MPYTVETSYGTFNTYQIIIQGRERVDRLAASVYQNKVFGYDLYAENSGVVSEMSGLIGDILFEKAAFLTVKSRPETEVISKEAELFEALKSLDDTMTADKSVSDKRLGQSYRIYCSAVPTVTFVCVQDDATKVWRHTLTINSVAIEETHQFYMSFAKGRGGVSHVSGEKDFSRIIDHPESAHRLYDAVAAYRGGQSGYDNVIKSYVFRIQNDGGAKKAFRLEIPAPLDFNELILYCRKAK